MLRFNIWFNDVGAMEYIDEWYDTPDEAWLSFKEWWNHQGIECGIGMCWDDNVNRYTRITKEQLQALAGYRSIG
jgi:hypothetical protein